MNLLEYIGSIGGISGVLAVLLYLAYRAQVRQMRDDRKFMEERLVNLIKDYNSACGKHTEAMIKHTEVLTELITWLKRKNGHN